MKYKIPFIKPNFPKSEDIIADYEEILNRNWYTNFGPFERRFAKEIGDYIGDGYYAATFSNATMGLMASIMAILGKGDGTKYIIIPSFTFAAGAEAIIWCGYKPLFIDIETPSLQMSASEAKKAIETYSEKITAILFCNAFGVGAVNIDEWEELSKQTDKPLIIDSAAGFGSLYSAGRKVGTSGVCEVFSFHATKPFSIGEGGAVVSSDRELIKKLEYIQNFGFDDTKTTGILGFNAKLQEINAAIGLRQLEVFEHRLETRRQIYGEYVNRLNPEIYYWQENAGNASLCFATVIVKDASQRDKILSRLIDAGVEAKTYYNPSLHKHAYFKDCDVFSDLENNNMIDESIISLPIHDNMRQEDINLIIETLS